MLYLKGRFGRIYSDYRSTGLFLLRRPGNPALHVLIAVSENWSCWRGKGGKSQRRDELYLLLVRIFQGFVVPGLDSLVKKHDI